MTSAAWWAMVSAALTLGGSVWSGVVVDAPWDAERGYELGAYQRRDGVPRMIDFEGRLTRIKDWSRLKDPENFDCIRKGTAAVVWAELMDDQGTRLSQSLGRADPVTGRFEFV